MINKILQSVCGSIKKISSGVKFLYPSVFSSFVPMGIPGEYYQVILKGDLKHGGKR